MMQDEEPYCESAAERNEVEELRGLERMWRDIAVHEAPRLRALRKKGIRLCAVDSALLRIAGKARG